MFDERKYQETFAQVRASEETLSEVLKLTKKNNTGVRVTRMLVIAAIISAMMATTVFAYVGFTQYENPMMMLKTFFGNTSNGGFEGAVVEETYFDYTYTVVLPTIERVPLDEEVAESDVVPFVSDVGESITYEDYTLTVEAHLYDSATDCGVIYYMLENPNGVSGYKLQYNDEVWWPGGEMVRIANCHGENFIIHEETTATKLSVAHYYCAVDKEQDHIAVSFTDRVPGGEYDAKVFEALVLKLPLNDGGGMKHITLADGTIDVSPVAIRMNIENMDFLSQIEPYDNSVTPPLESNIDHLAIRYADDTEYVLQSDPSVDNTMYALTSGFVVSYAFNRLIDVDQIEAVIINDVEFPVTE